ncbi:MAG: 1-acyl-sn-glycerol-3-phosphate acyltransferase [Candidatus Margulisbacteria bacterium]|nr:1-acyl-sn-glycerol-3-phosphate acyltransferase [Candidatus Margulisiibacteriota bacterium]MBU1022417.1 1-acyl-sn-glycerol-3-phosphate acyltransferase [Candidatus Margulisiibacteriota bacterium]MBU1729031.1 1-acyl-sn-glycerol-3-phosphate acyltransferase [Candidatus Margulisiibacteriota bacterium]MBU1954548.1 1-acyl-sn-glycerol-3-phosphate acyltransferase [Candidatus Margulisiibacteriota bacterium]
MSFIVNLLHTIFIYIFVVITFIVGTMITTIVALFASNKQHVFQKAANIWAKIIIAVSRTKVKVEGIENIPADQPLVLAANHQSAADILILLANIPLFFKFVIKRELFKVPIFGTYLRLAGYIPIDRFKTLKAHKTLYDTSKQIRRGETILIFPEGTRTRDGSLGQFKRGSLVIAKQSGVPVLPIAISGSFDIMPRGTFIIHPSKVKLTIGEPIPVNDKDMEKTIHKVRSKIESMLKESF